jgi:hypothetical protein
MGFHQHIHQMEAGAEAVLDEGGIPAIRIGAGKAPGALEDVGRTGEAVLGQQRGRDPALRRMGGLDTLGRRSRVIELRDAAGIATGQSDRLDDALRGARAAKQQPARGSGGAEAVAGAGALEASKWLGWTARPMRIVVS